MEAPKYLLKKKEDAAYNIPVQNLYFQSEKMLVRENKGTKTNLITWTNAMKISAMGKRQNQWTESLEPEQPWFQLWGQITSLELMPLRG